MVPLRPSTIICPVLVFSGVLWIYDVGHSQLYEVETAAILRAQKEAASPASASHIPDQTTAFRASPIVSAEALASGDDQGIVESNFSVVDSLRDSKVPENEINRAALESRYVDFFYGEMVDGGFAQFVGESEWDSQTVAMVRKGLVDIKAFRHLELFDDGAAIVAAIDPKELRQFINTPQPSSKDPVLRKLSLIDRQFFAVNDRESLVKLNAAWLRQQPNLIALSPEALRNELQGRGVYLPHRDKISVKS
ncbi:hypothetical protein GA0061101_12356 [Rhizobium lusitanum]|uniref:DNA mimic protein DMP19 C-terminal domain-containing protein n=1 Tax=Rhizobium lusitanum TaxID=293958 RepID=A0A1C3X3K3_9HYPH|nr:hypothetical protein GA0061101_12356 [Rhizobium lusitanum]